jgi:beta-mannosidase
MRVRLHFVGLLFLSLSLTVFIDVAASTEESPPAFASIRDGATVSAAIDLNGDWQFRATDETEWLRAHVPGVVQSDLLRAGRLKDPYYRDQELEAQWVEKKEWEYRRSFTVAPEFLKHDRVLLDARGLDTIAEVFINQTLVAKTKNMFVEYEWDIKPLLRAGQNEIHVVFRSILEWNKQQIASDPKVIWCQDADLMDCRKGNVFFARKEPSNFGWNWGPRLLSSGIWRPIRIAAYDTARITELSIRQDLSNPACAILNVTTKLDRFDPKTSLELELDVTLAGRRITSDRLNVTSNELNRALAIPQPRLWWPNGWGEHPLYEVTARLTSSGHEIHRQSHRVGLRMLRIIREKDARGESFAIEVNGKILFAKGVNWIPADALTDQLTEANYRRLLEACVRQNMNMIRVWGGGLYEADVFYEFADENGLLIWHDFMFAVGPYIANPSYLENVRAEIANVVKRLRHHPSIALWCGNNEHEVNMAGGQNWMKKYPTATWAEYDKIFSELIPQTTGQLDPDRPYWPSSPHHPLDREKKSQDADGASGNTHNYDVWDGAPFSTFDKMGQYRFVAEFGHQSLPDIETIRAFTAPEDRYFGSSIIDHHELNGNGKTDDLGTTRIARQIAILFGTPNSLENWVYLSQLVQAEGIRRGVEALRRNHPHSTGALYWQLNDNWPVISDSSIDYYGRWKALHYYAGRFFSPVLVSGVVEEAAGPIDLGKQATLKLWGVNDRLADAKVTLRWRLGRFDGTVVRRGEQDMTLPANRSTKIAELDFAKEVGEPAGETYRKKSYENRRQYYVSYELVDGDRILSSGVSFFVPQKYLALQEPEIERSLALENGKWIVTLGARRFAAYVQLGIENGYARFSDNYFHLLPGETRRVEIIESGAPVEKLRERLRVKSLRDAYAR